MNSTPPDILCIDASALSDLMFWNQLTRAFAPRPGEPPLHRPCVVLVGSGERAERAVADPLTGASREDGVLSVPPDRSDAFERAVREENKDVVHHLTDAGVASVGFVGGDRNLVAGIPERFSLGDWGFVRRAVEQETVPVVSAAARSTDGKWHDIDPFSVVCNLVESTGAYGRSVLLAQRLTPSLRQALEAGKSVSLDTLLEEGALPGWRAGIDHGLTLVQHVEWLGRAEPCQVT